MRYADASADEDVEPPQAGWARSRWPTAPGEGAPAPAAVTMPTPTTVLSCSGLVRLRIVPGLRRILRHHSELFQPGKTIAYAPLSLSAPRRPGRLPRAAATRHACERGRPTQEVDHAGRPINISRIASTTRVSRQWRYDSPYSCRDRETPRPGPIRRRCCPASPRGGLRHLTEGATRRAARTTQTGPT